MTKITLGLIGAGYWGRNLLRNFEALGVIQIVGEANKTLQTEHQKKYPDIEFCTDSSTVLTSSVDAVAIATPAETHGTLVRAALEFNKHVFVEKPLCLDLDEAEDLRQLAEEKGRILMVGHLLLYHPAYKALRKVVQSGVLGKLRYLYSNRLSLGKIRRSETVLWSFAPHDISMILGIIGVQPARVTTNGGHFLTAGVADTTMTYMSFPGGVEAHIFVSWLHPFKEQKLVVIGDRAMAVFNDVAAGDEKLLLYKHKASWDGALPVIDKAEAEPIIFDQNAEPLHLECQAFIDAVTSGDPPPSNATEGIGVLRVLDASHRSLMSGETVLLK